MRHFAFKVFLALIVSCIAVVFIYLLPASSAQDNNQQSQQAQKIERGPGKRMAEDKAGIQRLKNKTNREVEVKSSEATGATRFVNFARGKKGDLSGLGRSINAKAKSIAFFNEFGSLFGINNDKVEMRLDGEKVDGQGNKHQTFKQFYKGVPVFAGILKTHFDKEEQLNTVNGNAVPEIELDTTPVIDGQNAAATATTLVAEQKGTQELTAKSITLYVYRTGLVEGISGDDYLAYEVEVTNGSDVREFVYVDAHSGKIVDQFTGIHNALDRRAYNSNGGNESQTNAIYAGLPFWKEGDPFPTGNAAADNILLASKETYDLFYNAFNRDSFDGLGKKMDSIFNVGYSCPNAFWNGNFIGVCAGWTTDDMTAHEWTHAHTSYTHGLIYAYQPGALNESYSDIFGETIDRMNSRDDIGNSELDPARTTDSCSIHTPPVAKLVVNSPAALAGTYPAQQAAFGPALTSPLTEDVVVAIDALETTAGSTTNDGCSTITNAAAVNGKIALVYRGVCGFSVKVYNAQKAGAVGVIVANNISGHFSMPAGPNSNLVTIPSLSITKTDGDNIVANLANTTVNTTLQATAGTDASSRWLFGEDVNSTGLTGALRDMYNPTCKSHPGKVSDTAFYNCEINSPNSPNNGPAVHINSGVPNHAFALLVDGGTYNGQTINAIGLTKAVHIYYRAIFYQVPNSNFIDHADSLEQSAADLIASGTNLPNLKTGAPSGEIFTQNDLEQVKKAMLAVEMRKSPTFCGTNFILDKNTPEEAVYTVPKTFFSEDFETGAANWTLSNEFVAGAVVRNWVFPRAPGRVGKAAYVMDPNYTCNTASTSYKNQTGVMSLESPAFQLPNDAVGATLSFDHRIASQFGYDGGQLMVSVNGGAFVQVPDTAFAFNKYNATFAAASGNTNPRAGQKAFSGTDDKTNFLEGSWGKSIVDLSSVALPGQTIKFRWDFSNDSCGGQTMFGYGWFVDNVKVYGGLLDSDSDSVADAQDNCPLASNSDQSNNDGDNQGDVCDEDDDNDGVLDTVDNCPLTSNPDQTDTDSDGKGNICDETTAYEGDVFPRPNGDGVIDSVDVTQIRRFSVGLDAYEANEFQKADSFPISSKGDGFVDSVDVTQARRFSLGLDGGLVGVGGANEQSNSANIFDGILNVFANAETSALTAAVSIGSASNGKRGERITIPILVDAKGNEAAYGFTLNYDSTKLTNPIVTIGDSGGDVLANTNETGKIGLSITNFDGISIANGSSKVLIYVTFSIENRTKLRSTNLTFSDDLAKRSVSASDPNVEITQPSYFDGIVQLKSRKQF